MIILMKQFAVEDFHPRGEVYILRAYFFVFYVSIKSHGY